MGMGGGFNLNNKAIMKFARPGFETIAMAE